jgi:hypothetical protein
MTSPLALLEQTRKRLIWQQRINTIGLFFPPLLASVVIGSVLLPLFSLSLLLVFSPAFGVGVWMIIAVWRAKHSVESVALAALIDEKAQCQERFLTLATVLDTESTSPLVALLQRQTEEKTAAFNPQRAFPFVLDRRVPFTVAGSVFALLVLFLLPLESAIAPPVGPTPNAQTEQSENQQRELEKLTDFARSLMRDGKTPQEKIAGAQLLALAEQLKDPTIPPEEKQRLIEETKQRMELPLPQILPFQLDFFAGKDDKGKGEQNNQSQQDGKQQDKNKQNPDPSQTPQQSASGNQPQQEQPGSQKGDKKNEQPKPQESGGGIKFNQPKPQQQGEKREQSGQESSGEQQKSDSQQSPDSRTQGTDPNRPGGQNGPGQDPQKPGQSPQPKPEQPGPDEKSKSPTVGGSRGERFLKPGEQPGGFLTKDARFVKVRVPFGDAPQGEGDKLTENYDRAQPKTPYSNAPLKEAPPDQAQPKQPIPLEYRTILK